MLLVYYRHITLYSFVCANPCQICFFFLIIFYGHACFVHMSVHHVLAWCSQWLEEGFRVSDVGYRCLRATVLGLGIAPRFSRRAARAVSSKPSLQPQDWGFCCDSNTWGSPRERSARTNFVSETHWHVTKALVDDGWVFRGLSSDGHLTICPFWKVLYSLLSLMLAMKLTRPQAWGMQPQFLLFLVFSPASYSAASALLWHPECIVLKCGNCLGAGWERGTG